MVEAIERWDISSERNINYRSFLPLLRLVDIYHTPQCQHWAVWALANLTTVYRKYIYIVKFNSILICIFIYKKIFKFKFKFCYLCNNII